MAEKTRDEIVAEAIALNTEDGFTDDLSYDGPGRTEGNSDRQLANALDLLSVSGRVDEQSGDVEAPTGHFARIERWLLVTDVAGFVTVVEYETVELAREAFAGFGADYDRWESDGEGD